MFGQTQRLQQFKGFVFTLDALFALVIILLAASVLLVFAIQPISFVSSKAISSSHLASSLASIKLKDLANANSFVRNIISFQKNNWNQYMGDQFHSASAPSGPQLYLLFNFTPGTQVTSPPVIWNDYLIFGAGNTLYALNSSNGKLIWSFATNGTGNVIYYSPIVFNNTVIFDTTANALYMLNLTNGRQIWKVNANGPTGAPYIFENMIFVPTGNKLMAFSLNGTQRWALASNAQFNTPVATKGLLVTSTNKQAITNYIYFLSFTPTQVWNATKIVSASFNGVNSYIQLASQPPLSQGFTFVAWVKLPSLVPSGYMEIFNNNQFFIRKSSVGEGNYFDAFVKLSDGSVEPRARGVPAVGGKWTFVAATWDKTYLKIYINGALIGSSTRQGSLTSTTVEADIGRGEQANPSTNYWNGMIANIQIYNTSLTPQQIQQLYLQGINSPPIPNAGLVGWWPLQGNANDYSPYNNFGTSYNIVYNSTYPDPITGQTIVGNKIIFGSGKGVYAYYFNGSSAWNFSTGASTVTGPISSYKNKVFFQTTGGIYALYSNNGSLAWYASPSLTASSGDYPVIGGDKVYAIWGDNKIYVYNTTNGNIISSITVPMVGSGHTSLALANGNLYVGMGNNIYAFGSCKADPNDTVLNAIARFYANKQYFCANMLAYFAFSNSSQQTNYGLWVNDTFLPSISAGFNGVNTYVKSASANGVGNVAISECLWVKFNGFNKENQFGYIRSSGTSSARYFYFSSWCGSGAPYNCIHLGTLKTDGTWGRAIATGRIFETSKWYFICGVIDTANGFINAYINGSLFYSATIPTGNIPGTPYEIWIGGTPENYQWMNGTIAGVQIYSAALTPQQIQQLYLQGINSLPIPNAGLVGWWPLNGDTNDYSGWFNTGFPFNGLTFNATSYPISFTTSSSSTAFGAGFNAYGSTNATRAFDIAIAGWSK
jgi:outer membrane protein assembly factor BamB